MQTTYNLVPAVGVEGQIASDMEGTIIVPRLAQGLVPVGKLCANGTDSMTGPPLTTLSSNSTNPGQVKALPAGIVDNPILTSQYLGGHLAGLFIAMQRPQRGDVIRGDPALQILTRLAAVQPGRRFRKQGGAGVSVTCFAKRDRLALHPVAMLGDDIRQQRVCLIQIPHDIQKRRHGQSGRIPCPLDPLVKMAAHVPLLPQA